MGGCSLGDAYEFDAMCLNESGVFFEGNRHLIKYRENLREQSIRRPFARASNVSLIN